MNKLLLLLAALLVNSSLLLAQPATPLLPRQEDDLCRQWVDRTLAGMSLKEKVGQLFVCTVALNADAKTQKRVKQLVKQYKVGALLYSGGRVEHQAMLTNLAQRSAKIPLMITFDGEWGLSMRLEQTPLYPKNAALGCIADNGLIETYGREVARQLKEMGVQVNFAPDADVHTNPLNPVIHVRSFGENPKAVADKVVAYCRGLESGGVLSVVKHFPGHGDTEVDSHQTLPRIYYDRNRLDSVELRPFREAIHAGVGGVMVGHLLVPALEPDGVTASSLSRSVVSGVLKEEMGFRGLVFTDALAMKGVASEPNVTVKALKAGNDLVLVQQDVERAQQTVLDALAAGTLPLEEIEAKCRKVLTYKYLLGLNRKPNIKTDGLIDRICTPEAEALAARLRTSAVTALGNHFGVLPLTGDIPMALLSIGEGESDETFRSQIAHYTAATPFRITRQTSAEECKRISEQLRTYRRVILSLTVKDDEVAGYGTLLETLNLQMPTIYALFSSYRALAPLEAVLRKSSAVILAHSAEEDLQRHVADLLFGKASAKGRLPMHIGNLYRAGEGTIIEPNLLAAIAPDSKTSSAQHPTPAIQPEDYGMKGYILHRIDSLLRSAITEGAFPGCQVLVLKEGKPIYDRCLGSYSAADSKAVRPTDLYDLSSLTQTTATLLAVMKLCDEGRLQLTDRAATFLPWLQGTDKRSITIRELLQHQSGLPPHLRFFRQAIDERTVEGPLTQGFIDEWHHTRIGQNTYACSNFQYKRGLISPRPTSNHTLHVAQEMWLNKEFLHTIRRSIAQAELGPKHPLPGDLGYIVLQQVVEAIAKRPLDEYLTTTFYAPMGLTRTLFHPLKSYPSQEIAPTASNDFLRRQNLCGFVHDEAAAFLGGVAGNAGLFSTAHEVGRLYQMLLNGGELDGQRYLSPAICRDFTPYFTAVVVGATGTHAWADPENGLVHVFLSNRGCPDVWNAKMTDLKVRQKLRDIIYQSLK